LLIKYIKSVLWRVEKCLSYIEDARCLKVKSTHTQQLNLIFCDRTSPVQRCKQPTSCNNFFVY